MGNQYLSVIWKILNILNIFMSTLYLMLYPLILVKISLLTKVISLLRKDGGSQITIHPLQCMLIFYQL